MKRYLRAIARPPTVLAGIGLLAAFAAGLGGYWWLHVDRLDLRYVVSVRDPRTGSVDVLLEVRGITKPLVFLASPASEREMRLEGFSAFAPDGTSLATGALGTKRFVAAGLRRAVLVRYTVTPGALDRHGHQGLLTRDFGLVPGRVLFLVPTSGSRLGTALVRFSLPAGWSAVHPFETRDGLWYDASLEGGYREQSLVASSFGFGRWTSDRSTIEGTRFEVHAFDGWSPEYRERVSGHARMIFTALQQELGFRLNHKVAAVLVPKAPDDYGIIAGYWSNGLGHDMDDTTTSWSLFAHRIAHIFNREAPHGVRFKEDPRYAPVSNAENWINEGIATFLEIWAVRAASLSNGDERLDELWSLYLDRRVGDPRRDIALSGESTRMSGADRDYLHYVKALLFMENLDALLRRQSAGAKSLAGFLGETYRRYGGKQRTLPFIDELQQYAGFSLAEFFDRYTIRNHTLLPAWDGFTERYGGSLPPRTKAAVAMAAREAAGEAEGDGEWPRPRTAAVPLLSPAEQRTAVRIARDAINHYRATGKTLSVAPSQYQLTGRLRQPANVFVTLRLRGKQRGCMGALNSEAPLFIGVARAAIAAAFRDPRYPPASGEELAASTLDVSVLSADHPIAAVDDIALGRDGLILQAEGRRAYLLPYVSAENGWNLDETLAQLALKAGLPRDGWTSRGAVISTFTAQTFSR